MSTMNASEIISVLKSEIEDFDRKSGVQETGTVVRVGYGIAMVFGMQLARYGELVEFDTGVRGIVQNLETKTATAKKSGSTSRNVSNTYGAAGVVSASQSAAASVRSDAANAITLNRGSMYTFKMTVVNGNGLVPSFTVGNGSVLKTQFVTQIGNDYYYRVYAVGTPGQSTGVYTTLPGQNAKLHCTVTIG